MKKFLLSFLLLIAFTTGNAQENGIGVTSSIFFPLGSKPTLYRDNNANSYSIYFEHHTSNGAKYQFGVGQLTTSQNEWYYDDTATNPQILKFPSKTHFLTIPFTYSFNFLKGDEYWEFFPSIGYSLFIRYRYDLEGQPESNGLIRYDPKVKSDFFNYATVGIAGRYKYSKHLLFSMGLTSYHFIPVNNPHLGYPSISANAGLTYRF